MTRAIARSSEEPNRGPDASAAFYHRLFRTSVLDRIKLIKVGISAVDAKSWLDLPALGRNMTLAALDLPVATFNKRVKANARLSPAESERVVGFARLVGQVEEAVGEARRSTSFDSREWLARWLTEPLPALGNARPIDFMDTMEGQALVSQKLAQGINGAYA